MQPALPTRKARLSHPKTLCCTLVAAMLYSLGCGGSTTPATVVPPPPPVPANAVVVNFGSPAQVIRGFGGSEAFFGTLPSIQINTLYGTAPGDLGLSIMRVRIAPTAWNTATQTADTSAWTAELSNAAAAQALGATIFATPWTPPASMKDNGNVNEGSLIPASYADYANYLESYVNFATSRGVNLYAISMQNEPDWNPCGTNQPPTASGCYESALWSAAQIDTWIAQNSSVLTTKLIMPESLNFSEAMSDPTLNDANAVSHVGIVGGHLYGSSPAAYPLAQSLNKDVWMTEHTVNLAVGETTTQSMPDAIAAALEIHNSMTVGQYNAYVYWWLTNATSLSYYSGLLDTNNSPTYFGAALAQFARFVRPGYVRYAASNPISGVYFSAYAGNGHLAIVAINTNATATSVPLTIQPGTVGSITSLTPYQTTSGAMLAEQTPISVTGNNVTYSLPGQSIVTLVQ
jgi:O-glycosyl hydrolase